MKYMSTSIMNPKPFSSSIGLIPNHSLSLISLANRFLYFVFLVVMLSVSVVTFVQNGWEDLLLCP